MNVLLFALGSHGDVHPFVGIGIGLRQRGHRVAVAANEYFKPLIEHSGLEFIELGTERQYRTLATNRDLWHPTRSAQTVFNAMLSYLPRMHQIAVDFASRPDSVIAASTLAVGARVAQETHNLRVATVHLQPTIVPSAYTLPEMAGLNILPRRTPLAVNRFLIAGLHMVFDSMLAPKLNEFRARFGLKPVRGIMKTYWHSPRLVIGLWPDWYAKPQADWPKQMKLTGFPLFDEPDVSPMDDSLRAFLDAGDAPIAFTPGSAMWQAHKFFDASVAACVKLDRRGVLLTRHRDHLPSRLPAKVIHVAYAPFSHLLPRCAALVHHGGIGTSAQAMAAGVRQLVTPFTHDQPDNAARLKRLGVATIVPPRKYEPDRVARELGELIESPRVAAAAREVASRFVGVDPIGQTCELIESLGRN